jgi:hypothetical protein
LSEGSLECNTEASLLIAGDLAQMCEPEMRPLDHDITFHFEKIGALKSPPEISVIRHLLLARLIKGAECV